MPRTNNPPKYRVHSPSGRAVVTLNGHDHYLGLHGSKDSRVAYDELIALWLAGGRRLPSDDSSSLTVAELILRYYRHCETAYAGRRTRGAILARTLLAMKPLKRLFGSTTAAEFGPKSLLRVRESLIVQDVSRKKGDDPVVERRSRKTVNDRIQTIKRMFRWAVREEIVPPSVQHGLSSVDGLRAGQSSAREPRKIRPAPDAHVDAVLPYLLRPVRAMAELQRVTGMRPGEAVQMRGRDLDMTGTLWIYKLAVHKTDYKGIEREIPLGPQAQEIIRPFLRMNTEEYLFRPDEGCREKCAQAKTHRRPDQKPNPRKTARRIRDHYGVGGYRRAITRACVKAKVPAWTPHQLRHSYATRIRKEYGIEAARVMLGHQHLGVTEIYAERDRSVAETVAMKLG